MNLKSLGVSHTDVTDLTALAGMNLRSLGVSHTDVTDLTPLAGMNLRSLYVSHTDVTDLTPLAGMNLKSLDVSHTDVTDLAPLAGFDQLHMLYADGTRVSDLSPLAGLRMTWLSINDARIAELPADLPQRAGHLSLTGNQITDLAPLVSSGVLSSGDQLLVSDNPLSAEATDAQIPALRRRGVEVLYATPDDHEDNDQPQSATPLPPGQASLVASFHTPADEDWYSFTLAGEMEARLTLSYPTDLRFPGYELYRSEGEGTENLVPLDHATTRSILFGSGHRLSLPAGTYLLRLFDRGVSPTEPLRQRVYEISLDVEHPGPEAEVTLPVRYGLGRDEIDLLGLAAGRTHVERIIITNRGSRPLPIEALSVAGEGLRLEPLGQDPAGVVLQPGETILTGLTVPTDDLGPMTGELVLSAVNGESWSWPISGVVETPVNVPDPTLRWLLENTVNRAGFALTPTTLASVRHLTFVLFGNWPEAPIRSLVGLEACTGLETLRLVEKTDLNDLSPMAELPSLRHFTLQLPHDIDLSPLANLESLETLNLAETPITNLQPLVDGSALEAGDALTIGSGLNRWETGFLSRPIVLEHIPQLQARGVRVFRESHYRGPAYDHPQTARRIGFGQPYRLAMGTEAEMLEVFGPYHGDDLSEIGPDRWFTIDLWEDSNVIIQTGALAGDTQVELFDGQDLDQPLAVSDAGGFARIERTGQQALGPGTYLLRVTGDGPVRGGTISVWRGPWRDGDINGDSRVDVGDLGILAANWQRTDAAWADGDLTGDLVVDAGDLGILADSWTG
jgi:Leucine-rich repeat (LRR) protein